MGNVHFWRFPSGAQVNFPIGVKSMVLGDNGMAFATDGNSVVSFSVPSLAPTWSYTSTGGGLSFVAATSGGGVTINDSQQGVIQLDSSGNAGTPAGSLQGSTPFQPGLPIFIAQDGTSSGAWTGELGGTSFIARRTLPRGGTVAIPGAFRRGTESACS